MIKQTESGIVYTDPAPEAPEPIKFEALTEWKLKAGQSLLSVFRGMPEELQVEFFARLKKALLRRGCGGILPAPRNGLVHELADVFLRGGHEQEEYT